MIAKWGTAIASLLFVILMIQFLKRLPESDMTPSEKGEHFIQILIVSISIIVVAVPEGLPLAVTLSLAYATIRMIKDNNLVRVLKACETIGNATSICTDKTGTLTENKMTVVAGTLGTSQHFVKMDEQDRDGMEDAVDNTQDTEMSIFFQQLPPHLIKLVRDGIAQNTTAFEKTEEGKTSLIGNKTETAMIELAKRHLGLSNVAMERANAKQVQKFPFNSDRKAMAILLETEFEGRQTLRFFVKGASELVLNHCTSVIEPLTGNLTSSVLSNEDRRLVSHTIENYASQSLRTIALAYRDFPDYNTLPPNPPFAFDDLFTDMTFIGVFGIKDPLRPGVIRAVTDCRNAGVTVRMVTGDSRTTAKAIATECGIYTDGIIIEGPDFRALPRAEMNEILPRLQVLARSSPEDKRTLVKRLKHLGEIVAVTGDGTNDAPALHAADVGFSMGIAGTEVAKEASSIILMDDNFSSIPKAIAWGRCVNESIKKFMQVATYFPSLTLSFN